MICELIGGPKDGALVDVDKMVFWGEAEIYFPQPDLSNDRIVVATYRALSHRAAAPQVGHLDFIGYEK
jgi:hypothetical protein